MNSRLLIPTILTLMALLGVLVVMCGLGLSMGFKKMSLAGFFGALAMLALLRFIGWKNRS